MGHRSAIAVLWLFSVLSVHAQQRGAVDWIFLVDTSASMVENRVFEPVKESLETFVNEASDGDSVSLYTFDRGVATRIVLDPVDRDEVIQTIRGLKAEGNRTHLGAAIAKGLDRSEDLQRRKQDQTRVRALVLFTDGKEDTRGIANPIPIDASVQRIATSNPSIFIVALGEYDTKLDVLNGRVIPATDAAAIRDVAQKIRRDLPKPPPPPPPPQKPITRHSPPATPTPAPPPEPSRLPWIAAALIALAAALATYAIRKRSNLLEGEIEIVRPRVAVDATHIGLPNFKAPEIALSRIVPVDALAGSDARLFVRRKSGAKRVCIEASSGVLRVNDIEVPVTELYDADTIRVGDATLRFNHIGHPRPQEDPLA